MAITKVINSESQAYRPVLTDTLVLDAVPTVNSFNSVTSDAVARAVAGASGEVPQVTENDNGKVLKAIYDAGGPAVEWGEAPNEVPTVTENDNAKVLTATYSEGTGSFAWSAAPKELPASLGTAGQVLTVNSGATGVEWATPSGGGGGSADVSAADVSINVGANGISVNQGPAITIGGRMKSVGMGWWDVDTKVTGWNLSDVTSFRSTWNVKRASNFKAFATAASGETPSLAIALIANRYDYSINENVYYQWIYEDRVALTLNPYDGAYDIPSTANFDITFDQSKWTGSATWINASTDTCFIVPILTGLSSIDIVYPTAGEIVSLGNNMYSIDTVTASLVAKDKVGLSVNVDNTSIGIFNDKLSVKTSTFGETLGSVTQDMSASASTQYVFIGADTQTTLYSGDKIEIALDITAQNAGARLTQNNVTFDIEYVFSIASNKFISLGCSTLKTRSGFDSYGCSTVLSTVMSQAFDSYTYKTVDQYGVGNVALNITCSDSSLAYKVRAKVKKVNI